MTDNNIDENVIKLTQEKLGKHVKKPILTDKLLKKPPFRFLYDVFKAVIKDTGFFEDLYTPDELNYDNIKDRDDKIKFLQKMIDAINIITDKHLTVRPSKIVAGHEPEKTNELLQLIGYVIENQLDYRNAIGQLNSDLKKKDNRDKAKEMKTMSREKEKDKTKDKPKENDTKSKTKINSTKEVKTTGKNKSPNEDKAKKGEKVDREKKVNTIIKDTKPTKEKNNGIKKDAKKTSPVETKEKSKSIKVKQSGSKQNTPSPVVEMDIRTQKRNSVEKINKEELNLVTENTIKTEQNKIGSPAKEPQAQVTEIKEIKTSLELEEKVNEIKSATNQQTNHTETSSANIQEPQMREFEMPEIDGIHTSAPSKNSSSKGSRRSSANKSKNEPSINTFQELNGLDYLNKNTQSPFQSRSQTEQQPVLKHPVVAEDSSQLSTISDMKKETTMHEVKRENTFTRENSRESTTSNRPRTSLRPPSARPASARPGAPRRRDKNIEIILQPNDQIKMSGINVKLESFGDFDDDGENLVIIEDPTTDSITGHHIESQSNQNPLADANNLEQQGHLVQQILETQKELVQQNVETQNNTNKELDNMSTFNARQSSARQMTSLRDVIQTLTKSVNPLGKLMDFIPEDIDAMQLELTMWHDTYVQAASELKRERSLTESTTEPMKNQLSQIESNIKEIVELNDVSRTKILQNSDKILKLLME